MEGILSSSDKQSLVSSFLEIAVGNTSETARQFLQATSWKLEEAIQLFYVGGNEAAVSTTSMRAGNEFTRASTDVGDEMRAPLPVVRETLYDGSSQYITEYPPGEERAPSIAFRNFGEEMNPPVDRDLDDEPRDNLASLYRPPFELMHPGPFDKAKLSAAAEDKWLLVNLQSAREFTSHLLNRDTWANEAVSQTIKSNFIFWQVYDITNEGKKLSVYYKVQAVPVILVIDPITGQKMRSWNGMVQPDRLLEGLLQYMEEGPNSRGASSHKRRRETSQLASADDEEMHFALDALLDDTDGNPLPPPPSYPPLPEESTAVDKNLICRVAVRLPDGRRIQRCFVRSSSVQVLWSFCKAGLGEAETRRFRLAQAVPGATKFLDYDSGFTLDQAGVANSMISVTWE